MMYCRYCNYFSNKTHSNETQEHKCFICEYSDTSLPEDLEEVDEEYPCCTNKMLL